MDFNNSHIILALSQMAPGLPISSWPGGHMAPCKKTTLQQIKRSPGHTEDHTIEIDTQVTQTEKIETEVRDVEGYESGKCTQAVQGSILGGP